MNDQLGAVLSQEGGDIDLARHLSDDLQPSLCLGLCDDLINSMYISLRVSLVFNLEDNLGEDSYGQ